MYHHPCPVCGLFQTERPSAHIVPAGGNYCLISKFSPFFYPRPQAPPRFYLAAVERWPGIKTTSRTGNGGLS